MAQSGWESRCDMLTRLGESLHSRRHELQRCGIRNGQAVRHGIAEFDKCALLCRWYGEAPGILRPEKRPLPHVRVTSSMTAGNGSGYHAVDFPSGRPSGSLSLSSREAMRCCSACLQCPRSAPVHRKLVISSGYSRRLYRTLFPSHSQVSSLIADSRIRGVSLTGSTAAGRKKASAAGENIRKMVMELGGSDPFVVFPRCQPGERCRGGNYSHVSEQRQS